MNKNLTILLAVFAVLLLSIAGCAKVQEQQTGASVETQEQAQIPDTASETQEPQAEATDASASATTAESENTASTDLVYIKEMTFNPETLTVPVGTTVTWEQKEETEHIVASDGRFESDALKLGDKFTYTFTEKGTYDYYCKLHPAMTGTVVVE